MADTMPEGSSFGSRERTVVKAEDRDTMLLALIGNLFVNWSNNESLLIYLINLLMKVDEAAAVVVFSTLNTTRARTDLIRRLSVVAVADRKLSRDLDALLERFDATTRVRNEFNHAMYVVDDKSGAITHTQSTRIIQQRGKLKFGEKRKIDKARLDELKATIREMCDLNRDIRDYLGRLQAISQGLAAASADAGSQKSRMGPEWPNGARRLAFRTRRTRNSCVPFAA